MVEEEVVGAAEPSAAVKRRCCLARLQAGDSRVALPMQRAHLGPTFSLSKRPSCGVAVAVGREQMRDATAGGGWAPTTTPHVFGGGGTDRLGGGPRRISEWMHTRVTLATRFGT